MKKNEAVFTKDTNSKTIRVERAFNAALPKVWKAWTDSATLDQWWAPKPYKAETKEMDFREGGHWLYAMVGPEGNRQWCKAAYSSINTQKSFSSTSMFCNEAGEQDESMPMMYWDVKFNDKDDSTLVTTILQFDSLEDMETIIKMGFEEGFKMGLGNLDEYLVRH